MIEHPIIFFLNTYGVYFLIVLTLSYLWFVEKKKEVAIHGFMACVISGAVALILKELYATSRPFLFDVAGAAAGQTISASFPSVHAALAFSFGVSVAFHARKLGIGLLVVAGLIAIGRVVANVHYPIDIAMGAIIGALIASFLQKVHFGS